MQETHVFSPNMLNTFRAGFSRAGYNLDSSLLASFPSSLDFRHGGGPGRHRRSMAASPPPALSGITSAGPNNAAGRLESPQSVHL